MMTTLTHAPTDPNVQRRLAGARVSALWLFAPSLVLLLIGWCELHSTVVGGDSPGLGVSGRWALQISAGWILAGAALFAWGDRLCRTLRLVERPALAIVAGAFAVTPFTLFCEWVLAWSASSLTAFLYTRAPMHLAAAALGVAAFAWVHRHRASRTTELPAAPLPAVGEPSASDEIQKAAERASAVPMFPETLEVMTGRGRTSVRVAEIECLQADRNYISVRHASGRAYLVRQTMASIERSLDPARFVRVHRSTIVNRDCVQERRTGGVLMLRCGQSVRIGRAFRGRCI